MSRLGKGRLGLSVLTAALMVAASLGAVSAAAATARTGAAKHLASASKGTIALVPGDSTDPFFLSQEAAAKKEAASFGYSFIYQGAPAYSPEAQVPILAALLAKKPIALLVDPTDPIAVTSVLKEFVAAGIPVISLDTTINDSSILVSRITSDNTQGGAAAADACAKLMKGSGDAAVIYTTPGTTTTNLRGQAFIAEMKKTHPGISVLTEYDGNEEATATSQVSSLLLGHPTLHCVFGTNDYAAEGAATAVKSDHDVGKVFIAGYDAEPVMVAMLKNGTLQILIAQKPALEAQMAVQFAHDYLTGHKSVIPKFVQLANVVMTPQNISSPSVSKWIYGG